jgi:hypothetical protein
MASEASRHALYNRLGEILGPEHADTLIQSLPMEPSTELATKTDIAGVKSDIARLEAQVSNLAASLRDYQKTTLVAIVGSMTALTTIFSIIVGLITH